MLLEIDNFIINDKAEIIGYSGTDPNPNTFLLGQYNTVDECIQVLDSVQKHIFKFNMPPAKEAV